MAVRLSALRVGRPLPPGRFVVLISVREAESNPGRVRSIGEHSELIGNRTRDPAACSIVPQPTTVPRSTDNKIAWGYSDDWKYEMHTKFSEHISGKGTGLEASM
jgi:hypothetical protein